MYKHENQIPSQLGIELAAAPEKHVSFSQWEERRW